LSQEKWLKSIFSEFSDKKSLTLALSIGRMSSLGYLGNGGMIYGIPESKLWMKSARR